VQKLGEVSLKDATLIKSDAEQSTENETTAFLAPAQLKQSYIVTPSKLRLVTLTALIKRTFARKGSVMKAIVFVSCADSVEFHFNVFTRGNEEEDDTVRSSKLSEGLSIFKLHGSLPQPVRTSIVKKFHAATTPSLLIATDVASRGLDLPNLDLVIEYDPAFSSDDHLHRIGRTARVGRDGRAIIFLLPGTEEGYVSVLRSSYKPGSGGAVTSTSADDVLKKGFSPAVDASQKEWENQATQWQLDLERWVLADKERVAMAKKAFQSQIRAYATHIAAERKWFDIKELHLGHTAKSFGLRDAPAKMNVSGMGRNEKNSARRGFGGTACGTERKRKVGGEEGGKAEVEDTGDAEEAAKKMRDSVRMQRKMMMGAGADEFNLA
jgi:ATP-dependent RNA helicase DDX31/DBP7